MAGLGQEEEPLGTTTWWKLRRVSHPKTQEKGGRGLNQGFYR